MNDMKKRLKTTSLRIVSIITVAILLLVALAFGASGAVVDNYLPSGQKIPSLSSASFSNWSSESKPRI